MAIVNRDHDASEQIWVVEKSYVSVGNGSTMLLALPPFPCTLKTVQAYGFGVSYSPILSFYKNESLGASTQAIGISGLVITGQSSAVGMATSFSGLAAAGSTLLQFNAGEALVGSISGTSTNCANLIVNMVFKKTQDIVSYFAQAQS